MTTNLEKFAELFELLGVLRDGCITDDQFAKLDQLLATDGQMLDYYIDYIQLCTELNRYAIANGEDEPKVEDLLREAIEQDERIRAERAAQQAHLEAEAKREAVKKAAEAAFEKFKEEERRRQEKLAYKRYKARQRKLIFSTAALAASLIFAVSAWFYRYLSPQIVAFISNSMDAQWANTDLPTDRGTQLFTGSLHLLKGFVEITFDKGAKVIVEAPAQIKLEDAAQMFLRQGRLTAGTPSLYAHGFTVNTPIASIKDIGTQFGLSVEEGNGESEFHVFEGEVILFTGGDKSPARAQQIVKKNQARRVDPKTKAVEEIAFNERIFTHSWKDVCYKIRTTGAVEHIPIIPPSLQPNKFEDDDHIRLFWERKGYILENEVTVADFINPGIFQSVTYSKKQDKIIPAGAKVDSCLMHIDRVHQLTGNDRVRLTGSVTFPRPVLGIIVTWKQLEATDAQLGAPGTIYEYDTGQWTSGRGIIEGSGQNDILYISADRHTLDLDFTLHGFDQVRVLIEAPPD